MRTYPPIPCPHCKKSFQPRRKNQDYCSTECRTDTNNARAKERYATFKTEAPKLETLTAQVRRLKKKLASATIVIKDVEEASENTIRYDGRRYKQQGVRVGRLHGVSLDQGVGLLTGNTITYRTKRSISSDMAYNYTLEA